MRETTATQPVIFGEADDRTQQQIQRCLDAEPGARGVLCADNHLGYAMPVGGVVAYREHVSPNGVGYDIACGNAAYRTDVQAKDVDVRRVMDEVAKVISFGMGRANGERIDDHPVYERIASSPVRQQREMLKLAADQLGTVGAGNHYVDLFEDRADGRLWVGVHFGSRGLGHKTCSGFLALAAGRQWGDRVDDSMDAPPTLLRLDSPLGQDYWEAMEIAGEYAYAGRDWVVGRVLKVLGVTSGLDYVHNHHNFAWRETHGGEEVVVVRKGATPAWPGQKGFVGGSMGEDAVIIEGVDSPRSGEALFSTVHGAGRVMSRTKAAGKTRKVQKWKCRDYRRCTFEGARGGFRRGPNGETPKCPNCGHKLDLRTTVQQVSPGVIDWAAAQAEVRALGIELRGAGADEAPGCYKRLPEVLAAHGNTIKVLHQLRVVGVAMAGAEIEDPFRD
jgi:tRNA-splicing ligase RtcB